MDRVCNQAVPKGRDSLQPGTAVLQIVTSLAGLAFTGPSRSNSVTTYPGAITAIQAAEKRAEATSEAQEDVLPDAERPKEWKVGSPQTSFPQPVKPCPSQSAPNH
jgi:hypothetical protein